MPSEIGSKKMVAFMAPHMAVEASPAEVGTGTPLEEQTRRCWPPMAAQRAVKKSIPGGCG
jgi:hypothetical protein